MVASALPLPALAGRGEDRLPQRGIEHDLALRLTGFHHAVGIDGARQRQDMRDLRLDLALGGRREAGDAVLGAVAWHAHDGDAAVIEGAEVDRHVRTPGGPAVPRPARAPERFEGAWQYLRVGDVVVEDIAPAPAGDLHHGV